ncbi:MAG: hypothetical protein CENE_02862 [Candidatus Celerinatantimonas neptuna]|nr:MAG: hypothetical protein CENE_02862 [Candidatus Celerinatantimonas neptuna]
MDKAKFDDYITRFNARDDTAFDDYLCPGMKMLNGALRFEGIEGMKDHYMNKIWPWFEEKLHIPRFISNEKHIAIEMVTYFTAQQPGDTLFGHVVEGERFIFHGMIMYDLKDDKFSSIQVAYNSFKNIKPDGTEIEMGIPH